MKSVVDAIKNIADGIKAGIDTIKTIINGEFSLKRIVEDFLDAVQELPGKVSETKLNELRKKEIIY